MVMVFIFISKLLLKILSYKKNFLEYRYFDIHTRLRYVRFELCDIRAHMMYGLLDLRKKTAGVLTEFKNLEKALELPIIMSGYYVFGGVFLCLIVYIF